MKKDMSLKKKTQAGFSVMELMVCLSLFMVLSAVSYLNFSHWIASQDQTLVLDRLKNAVEFTRNEAFIRNATVTLCASNSGKRCSEVAADWSSGFIVMMDPRRNPSLEEETILLSFPGPQYGRLVFTAQGNQLHMQAHGFTSNIGRFIYYPNNPSLAPKSLVLHWAGRTYLTLDL